MNRYGIGTVTIDTNLNIASIGEENSDKLVVDLNKNFLEMILPDDRHLIYEMIEKITEKEPYSFCFRFMGDKGEENWVIALCYKKEISGNDYYQITMQDISDMEEKISKERLDFGTGLLDKKTIVEYARFRCEHPSGVFNLCILDIDNFKNINDTNGHSFGDKVLKDVGTTIRNILGSHGKAGRIGGDEMMLIIDDAPDNSSLRSFLKPIRESIQNLYRDPNGNPLVTVSVGSARFPTDLSEYDALFDLADKMLYRAKSRGKNRYVMYNPDIHGRIVDGLYREEDKTIKDAAPVDKTRLVLETIEDLLEAKGAVSEQLLKIIGTYELDHVYVFYGDVSNSFCGFKMLESTETATEKGIKRIVEVTADISFVKDEDFDQHFNSNGVFVTDSPEKQLGSGTRADSYFASHDIKHAFIYKMKDVFNGGYVFFYNTNELSRKFSQPDITDFTYLGKMIEIALKSR